MDGVLNFLIAFGLMALALVVLTGKADGMMVKYRLTFKGGRPAFVKYCRYDAKRARPILALIYCLLALFILLEYLLRPLPEWAALILLALLAPLLLVIELRCRKRN